MKKKTKIIIVTACLVISCSFFFSSFRSRNEMVKGNIEALTNNSMITELLYGWRKLNFEAWYMGGGQGELGHFVKNRETGECMWDDYPEAPQTQMVCWKMMYVIVGYLTGPMPF